LISLEPELTDLRERGALSTETAERLISLERREVFSIHYELRALLYLAVTLIITGVGLYLKNNLDRIGPVVLILIIAAAAAGCYSFALAKRLRPGRWKPSLADDYVLLLGALLVSADLGYAESQFHIFDENWSWHLLLLAVLHGASAYYFDSRILLSVSITSLAAFLGINNSILGADLYAGPELAVRGYICAVVLLLWRLAHQRLIRRIEGSALPSAKATDHSFLPIFDHSVSLLVLISGLILVFEEDTTAVGTLLLLTACAAVFAWGWRIREQTFVIYAVISFLIGTGYLVADKLAGLVVLYLFLLFATIGAIAFLFWVRVRFREDD